MSIISSGKSVTSMAPNPKNKLKAKDGVGFFVFLLFSLGQIRTGLLGTASIVPKVENKPIFHPFFQLIKKNKRIFCTR